MADADGAWSVGLGHDTFELQANRSRWDTEMTIEQIRNFYNAQPFQPFVIHLADGREVPVLHREFIMSVPNGRTICVVQPDETYNIIDLLLVTDLEIKPTGNGSKRRRKA
jgi:hypothetical protein